MNEIARLASVNEEMLAALRANQEILRRLHTRLYNDLPGLEWVKAQLLVNADAISRAESAKAGKDSDQ